MICPYLSSIISLGKFWHYEKRKNFLAESSVGLGLTCILLSWKSMPGSRYQGCQTKRVGKGEFINIGPFSCDSVFDTLAGASELV